MCHGHSRGLTGQGGAYERSSCQPRIPRVLPARPQPPPVPEKRCRPRCRARRRGRAAARRAGAAGARRSVEGLGRPLRPYGDRSRFEASVRGRPPGGLDTFGGNFTPLDETLGVITPSALHFVVQRGGTPDIDPRKHRLLIHGLVDRPVTLTMEELRRLPSTSRILFLECQGNSQLEWRPPPTGADLPPRRKSVRGTHGLTSCSEWTGVPLSLLLREAGVQQGAAWILAEGADAT